MSTKRDLDFLYEIGCLRFAQRAWKQFFSPDFANITEHQYRVIWLSLILANKEGKGDFYKIMKMALVHDVTESRTGDIHYVSRHYTKRNENQAINDMLKGTSLEKEFIDAWQEYEERNSIEAKIVKDADWLDIDLELREQKSIGRTDLEAWDRNRKTISNLLYTKSAKQLWQEIQKSNPQNWHIEPINKYIQNDLKPSVKKHKKGK